VSQWGEILRDEIGLRLDRALDTGALGGVAAALRSGDTDPYSAALEVLDDPERLARLLAQAERDPKSGEA
jgi:hypothetical protein